MIEDLESRNGTYLNKNRIRYSQLLPGDQITAGRTTLTFRLSDDAIAVVSEPLNDVMEYWEEIPESRALSIGGGEVETRPFTPIPPA